MLALHSANPHRRKGAAGKAQRWALALAGGRDRRIGLAACQPGALGVSQCEVAILNVIQRTMNTASQRAMQALQVLQIRQGFSC